MVQLRTETAARFKAGDFTAALEGYQELAPSITFTAEERFRMAQCLAALGHRSEARKMVEEILESAGTEWLPHTSRTFTDVHFWLAQEIYTRPKITATQWRAVEAHLRAVLMYAPHHEMARRMLMKMQRATGDQAEALANLEKLAVFSRADRMELALAYSSLGMTKKAAVEAELVLASLLIELGEEPDDLALRRTGGPGGR